MDPYSTTRGVIKLTREIYQKYNEYQDADRTIKDARHCLKVVEVDLELFEEYLKEVKLKIPDRQRQVLEASLDKVSDVLHELRGKVPHKSTRSTKFTWVGWGKRRVEGLLAELRSWDHDTRGTFFMLDLVGKLRDADELRKRLFDTGDRAFTGAWALSQRIYSLEAPGELSRDVPRLQQSCLTLPETQEDRMLARYQDRTVYLEAHYLEGESEQKRRQTQVFGRLAYVFQSSDLPSLHLLSCVGLVEQRNIDRCHLIYDLPVAFSPSNHVPTLARALEEQALMTLEDRFRIAVEVTIAVFSVHAAGWVHKNIRSDNILVDVSYTSKDPQSTATVGTAYLVGFHATRPRIEASDQRAEMDPVKRMYQHPDRQGGRHSRVVRFDIRHDMYSLGAVLVEIGFQKTLHDIFQMKSSSDEPDREEARWNHESLVEYARRLTDKMGTKYANAALVCLTKSTESGKSSDSLREEFYVGVLCPLREILDGLQEPHPR